LPSGSNPTVFRTDPYDGDRWQRPHGPAYDEGILNVMVPMWARAASGDTRVNATIAPIRVNRFICDPP
jgi:hypothetical protein